MRHKKVQTFLILENIQPNLAMKQIPFFSTLWCSSQVTISCRNRFSQIWLWARYMKVQTFNFLGRFSPNLAMNETWILFFFFFFLKAFEGNNGTGINHHSLNKIVRTETWQNHLMYHKSIHSLWHLFTTSHYR